MDLHVFGCREHNMTVSKKFCLTVYVSVTNFCGKNWSRSNSKNFIFSAIRTQIDVYQLLLKIVQQQALLLHFFRNIWHMMISFSSK